MISYSLQDAGSFILCKGGGENDIDIIMPDPRENNIPHQSHFGFSKLLLALLLILFLIKEILLSASFIRKVWNCCPQNWKSFSSSCYFFSTDAKSWNESQENCSRMEAHLVVINSKEEQDFLTQNMDKKSAYFVGLSDPEGQGHWQWVDQTPYNQSATFWHPGDPSHGEECCVIVNHHATSFQWGWNDILCKYFQRSVCEMMKIYI
ncbi:C-type lectin domain family 4 member A-like [Ictidomys tridecemlineatus]|uniref:C-type lectin domain family 4 member A-like n=1 Tax=Ictidomys tridecemlineatus TaxID=43179 RepID=UPI00038C5E58|nr:C-type lectin domain family 4 member A-like [Ictidomys tridecemlineatus]KAG3292451.1 C-type lectin domain family 4 member A-like [Ictidomys tridecemlineatus]